MVQFLCTVVVGRFYEVVLNVIALNGFESLVASHTPDHFPGQPVHVSLSPTHVAHCISLKRGGAGYSIATGAIIRM